MEEDVELNVVFDMKLIQQKEEKTIGQESHPLCKYSKGNERFNNKVILMTIYK